MWAIDGIHGNPGNYPSPAPQVRSPGTGQETPAEKATTTTPANRDDITALADDLAKTLEGLGQGHTVAFRKDEETGTSVIEIRNRDGEVLNQFPPEIILNLRRVLADLSGVVINRMT